MTGRKYTPEERIIVFWSKTAVTANPDDCWEWQGCRIPTGYGRFSILHKLIAAHRFAWIITYGEIPDKMEVCHKCDNPSCVNPSHLFIGTHTDNMQDMVSKQRKPSCQAENNGNHILTWEMVREIRKRYATESISQSALGREYGVDQTRVSMIVLNKQWKE